MTLATQSPETDLLIPRPAPASSGTPTPSTPTTSASTSPSTRSGRSPTSATCRRLGICHAGSWRIRALDNLVLPDCLHSDYKIGCPYPESDGNAFTANGLTFDFLEPGRVAQITYRSADGRCQVDVRAEAVTPLAARGHVVPGRGAAQVQAARAARSSSCTTPASSVSTVTTLRGGLQRRPRPLVAAGARGDARGQLAPADHVDAGLLRPRPRVQPGRHRRA